MINNQLMPSGGNGPHTRPRIPPYILPKSCQKKAPKTPHRKTFSRPIMHHSSTGFTLVEILVSLVVMSIVIILAYNAFDGILAMESRSKDDFLVENRRSMATSVMLNDFLHMRPRPVRDQLGGVRGAFLVPSRGTGSAAIDYVVEFTRGGLPDVQTMAGGIQRVAYWLKNDKLIRTTWLAADASDNNLHHVLATGITAMTVALLDSDGQFVALWPPANENLSADALPAMIKIILSLEDGDNVELLIPGSQMDRGEPRSANNQGKGG